jgi:hypothetical protein
VHNITHKIPVDVILASAGQFYLTSLLNSPEANGATLALARTGTNALPSTVKYVKAHTPICYTLIHPTSIPFLSDPTLTNSLFVMEAPTNVPDTALPQSQLGSSDLPPSPGSSPVNAEARYLIRGKALQLYRLIYILRHLLRKEKYDTCVLYAMQVMPSGKAPGSIFERSTTPSYHVPFVASSNGLDPTSTGNTSGRSIQMLTQT